MTQKHFIAMAEYVRCIDADDKTRRQVAEGFIYVARQFNGRFDVERFLTACGL